VNEEDIKPNELRGQARNADQASFFLLAVVLVTVGVGLVFGITLSSWRPTANMERQPYYRPLSPTENFVDGMSQRPLVSGVVPRPADRSPGIPYVAVRTPGPANYPVIAQSAKIPFPINRSVLEDGQELYNTYCSMCHGALGDGRGMIVERGFYPPPSYHIPRLRQAADSHFFNVITNGYGTMFSYSERVAPQDRWKIVAYIRALQLAVEKHEGILSRNMQKPAGVYP
jgi:mono/diheme cytochrome c family protein